MSRFVSVCMDRLKHRNLFVPNAGAVLIHTGLFVAILMGFGGLAAQAGTLYPTDSSVQSNANSDVLAEALETGRESTDLDVEPMATDDTNNNESSGSSGTTVTRYGSSTSDAKAEVTDTSDVPIILRQWVYPWP